MSEDNFEQMLNETFKPIHVGEVVGDVSEKDMRRVQIRETIRSHFEKEKELYGRGIKCLSLFFIDEVAKYRKYDDDGNEVNSEYGQIFEEEYTSILNEYLTLFNTPYEQYLRGIEVHQTHTGYFSIDKRGRKVDSSLKRGSDESDPDQPANLPAIFLTGPATDLRDGKYREKHAAKQTIFRKQ